MFSLPYPCTGELSPYYKSFDKKNVFGLIFCVIACNGSFSIGFSAFSLFGAWLGPLGRLLGRSWRVLGQSWVTFGCSWVTLGASWGAFGALLGRLGGILEASWRHLGKMSSAPSFLEAMLASKMDAKINKKSYSKSNACFYMSFCRILVIFERPKIDVFWIFKVGCAKTSIL